MTLKVNSFFVGGETVKVSNRPIADVRFTNTAPSFVNDQNGHYHINGAYVQSFVPLMTDRTPVVLHHGGGMTGAMWESTPDGREGWLNFLLQANCPTYVIDNVERGRAGWPAARLEELGAPILRTEEEAWALFRFGKPKDYSNKRPFPNQRFPVEALSTFSAQFVPRWLEHSEPSTRAMSALLDKVGPCVVVAHSQGAECVINAARARPHLVSALVLLEPSAVPGDLSFIATHGIPLALLKGDYLDCAPLWRELREAYSRIVTSICKRGGRADLFDLSKEVGRGFSHMPMMDHGNELVFSLVDRWVKENTKSVNGGKTEQLSRAQSLAF